MATLTKINLGCGEKRLPGYLNVDKYGAPDLLVDLEKFPWPWPDDSFEEIQMKHVLEHLGQTSDIFLGIVRELYRVCKPGATLFIEVPHPRHDNFLNDPTHVRPITPELMRLFSVKANRDWVAQGASNSPLALYQRVDFELTSTSLQLEQPWESQYFKGELDQDGIERASRRYNNVINQITMILTAIKPWQG